MTAPVADPAPVCPTCLQPMTEVATGSGPHEQPATDAVVVDSTWRCADPGCPGSSLDPATSSEVDGRHEEHEAEANRPTGADDIGA